MKVFGVTGWKNSGKTGLMERLVGEIAGRGFSVSTLKHAHHGFDVDQPGKDSFRHRAAGAHEVLVASGARWALMHELRGSDEPALAELLARLAPVDLVLVEGWKRDRHAKIEAHRAATGQGLIAETDDTVRAIASDEALSDACVPVFDLDDTRGLADFVLAQVGLTQVGLSRFDTFIMVDWSGGIDRGPTPKPDAIWAAVARGGVVEAPVYLRNRKVAEAHLAKLITVERAAGRRVLVGFDFPFGFPAGFAKALVGKPDPLAVWDWFEARVEDMPKSNNRFDLAGKINVMFPGVGPFWGNGLKRDIAELPRQGSTRTAHGLPEKRRVETLAKGSFACWQLSGAGAVGSQVIMGLPVLARLRRRFDAAVWPFEPLDAPVALVEIWPSLIADVIGQETQEGDIKDAVQVKVLARALARLDPDLLARMLSVEASEEGWILGVGHEAALRDAARA